MMSDDTPRKSPGLPATLWSCTVLFLAFVGLVALFVVAGLGITQIAGC